MAQILSAANHAHTYGILRVRGDHIVSKARRMCKEL